MDNLSNISRSKHDNSDFKNKLEVPKRELKNEPIINEPNVVLQSCNFCSKAPVQIIFMI